MREVMPPDETPKAAVQYDLALQLRITHHESRHHPT